MLKIAELEVEYDTNVNVTDYRGEEVKVKKRYAEDGIPYWVLQDDEDTVVIENGMENKDQVQTKTVTKKDNLWFDVEELNELEEERLMEEIKNRADKTYIDDVEDIVGYERVDTIEVEIDEL